MNAKKLRELYKTVPQYNAVAHAVNHELKFYEKLSPITRRELFDRATAESLSALTEDSTAADARRVSRTTTRRVIDGNLDGYFKQDDTPLEEIDEPESDDGDDLGAADFGTGIFGGCSLHAKKMKAQDASAIEDELIGFIELKRRLSRFIEEVGIERWRWFFKYLRAERKPDNPSERVRFCRMRKNFLATECNKRPHETG